MAYIPGEHYVLCAKCLSNAYRSECVRDRTKLLVHRKCADWDWPKAPNMPRDPKALPGNQINIEGPEVFIRVNPHRFWDEIEDTWDTILLNWEDV